MPKTFNGYRFMTLKPLPEDKPSDLCMTLLWDKGLMDALSMLIRYAGAEVAKQVQPDGQLMVIVRLPGRNVAKAGGMTARYDTLEARCLIHEAEVRAFNHGYDHGAHTGRGLMLELMEACRARAFDEEKVTVSTEKLMQAMGHGRK